VTPARVVLDCDPGIDDALALAVLADAASRGEIELTAVIAVGGNVGLDQTAANAVFLVDRFGLECEVLAGAAFPMGAHVPGDAAHVHGLDGIGGLHEPGIAVPEPSTPAELVAAVERHAPVVLVATGPLTNVAQMLEARPDLGELVARVVVMGGAFGDPPGNVTDEAEFNAWIDPEAAEAVFASSLPVVLVPLDVTTKVTLDRGDAARLAELAGRPTLVSRLVDSGADLYEALGLTAACEMHDPLAAALALAPDLLPTSPMGVRVETRGEARGRTERASDGRRPIEVALEVDAPVVTAHLFNVLSRVTAT
jgi:inosine-uridine nucleoside N-ribohydrolase